MQPEVLTRRIVVPARAGAIGAALDAERFDWRHQDLVRLSKGTLVPRAPAEHVWATAGLGGGIKPGSCHLTPPWRKIKPLYALVMSVPG